MKEGKFEQVRFMDVRVDENGVVRAVPHAAKAGSASTQSANAVYMLEANAHSVYPVEGEVIQLELRV